MLIAPPESPERPILTPWASADPPTRAGLDALLARGGLSPRWWSNGPGDRYGRHDHPYRKVLYCASGSIRFEVGANAFDLSPGDRLDIPPGTPHSAVVGREGVTCVEAYRR